MLIMIAGPYLSGARTQSERDENLRKMNESANAVFALGHTPVIGVNMALPMIAAADADAFERIMMPVSLALASHCDAILRIGGPSTGADQEMKVIRDKGGKVFESIDEIENIGVTTPQTKTV